MYVYMKVDEEIVVQIDRFTGKQNNVQIGSYID